MPVASAQEKSRPYDRDLFRLSELLGAIHYLRELCASGDGTRWRDQMEALIEAEGTSALRKVTLTKRFNKGYRSFQRTYRSCTQTAETAIARFVGEGAEIAARLIKDEDDTPSGGGTSRNDG
ncbi:MAG: TIGR02301 family protein [Pseudomonadota bacterium]